MPWSIRLRLWWLERRLGGNLPENKRLGYLGEAWAARHLRGVGYRVLARNVMTDEGEADLVCRGPDGAYVVVEVKTRRVDVAGDTGAIPPEASVHADKRDRLRRIARALARVNRWGRAPVRVDAVAIEWPDRGEPVVRHWLGVA